VIRYERAASRGKAPSSTANVGFGPNRNATTNIFGVNYSFRVDGLF
jgi:hypothetical protein